jgi:hypothetical protein
MGSLNDAAAFHLHYQNFSFVPAQGVPELAPGVEVSVPYFFTPAPSLPEHAFQVALTVFMVGEGGVRAASTPFNRTIDIVAPVRWIDFEMLGLWAALAGLVAGLGWVGYHSFGECAQGPARRLEAPVVVDGRPGRPGGLVEGDKLCGQIEMMDGM